MKVDAVSVELEKCLCVKYGKICVNCYPLEAGKCENKCIDKGNMLVSGATQSLEGLESDCNGSDRVETELTE